MDSRSNFYLTFSVWLVILPLLGIPNIWKTYLTLFSGIFLMLVVIGPAAMNNIVMQEKMKAKRKQVRPKKNIAIENIDFESEMLETEQKTKSKTKSSNVDTRTDDEKI